MPAAANRGVEASYELRRRSDDELRQGPATPIAPSPDGRLVRLLALGLEGIAQGDYELVLRIEDKSTGETREQVEPLQIGARAG